MQSVERSFSPRKYVDDLRSVFEANRDMSSAVKMSAYMKNKFSFLGIKSPERKELSKSFMNKGARPPVKDLWTVAGNLWEFPEREYQYVAMYLVSRYNQQVSRDWMDHYQHLITDKSWWDTVDFVAINLVGNYFMKFPEEIPPRTAEWMKSDNMWLQRSCILFQLKYKKTTDTALLSSFILSLSGSREFFVAKAIGWALREYAKSDPQFVVDFVQEHQLQPLSRKEALRRIT